MREIRMLRATWRGLETESRTTLLGHEERKLGYRQGKTYGLPRQSSTLPRHHNNPCVAPARVLFRQYAFADGADQSR